MTRALVLIGNFSVMYEPEQVYEAVPMSTFNRPGADSYLSTKKYESLSRPLFNNYMKTLPIN